jgi:multimeric flavodoxin WrbA
LKALFLSCTLKKSPETSNTESLARVLANEFESAGVETEFVRVVDHEVPHAVTSDEGDGDEWPAIREKVVGSQIVVFASPTWLGRPSSVAQKTLERLDAMIAETDEQERPLAYNKVAGVVVTGNEDGAHHVIGEISGALVDIGFTIPGQSWTYWNKGPGPGEEYSDTDEGHEWSHSTGRAAAQNLLAVARALESQPISASPS